MRILFWGTPEFACVPLRALLGEGYEVIGVVTQPDKAQGRNREMVAPPVKPIASEERIPVFQPATPRDPEFLEILKVLAPDLSVVVAYGHILPQEIIGLPPLGTLNIHASLLPDLRGAAPIQAAIREGLTRTGVTIMRMVPKLDAGPIIHQAHTPIAEDETYGELQLRLAELGSLALIEALTLMSVGGITEAPQDDALATFAPKVTREMARVDWTLRAPDVARTIRAYDPKPGAFSRLNGSDVKLFGARALDSATGAAPGRILLASDTLVVACASGATSITDVQPAGRTRMRASEWSRGRGVSEGDSFDA